MTTPSVAEKHIALLRTAELQFRLASAVRLATTMRTQPLDLPSDWTHGRHRVKREEVALTQEEADYTAFFLHRSATYLMAVAVKDAIGAVVVNPKASPDSDVRSSYQIARLIRNAFAHGPFSPSWSIDADCQEKKFSVSGLISLDTTGLNGTPFDWRHYGGPLALFRLSEYVRTGILGDKSKRRPKPRESNRVIIQQGDLILRKVTGIPADAVRVAPRKTADGGIDLGDGHVIYGDEVEVYERRKT